MSSNRPRVDLDNIPLRQRIQATRVATSRAQPIKNDDSSIDSNTSSSSSSSEDDVPLSKRNLPPKKAIKRETKQVASVKEESDSEDDIPLVS